MFNIRVYGILINEEKRILLNDAFIRGKYYTKFPGGGLEKGEGTRDCLKREFKEEMNLKIEIGNHIYTTDFYQQSAFNPEDQIISVYYYTKAVEPITTPIRTKEFDFDERELNIYEKEKEIETFRFIDWDSLSADSVTLPIDKFVVNMLKGYC